MNHAANDRSNGPTRAAVAELALVVLLIGYGSFSVERLTVLLLLASQSLWIRGLGWRQAGLQRPQSLGSTLLRAVGATVIILLAVRFVIAPAAVRLAGAPIDHSVLNQPGDARALWMWLAQAWTLAAFVEEMVFRGYLIPRIGDLVGDTRAGQGIAILVSSALFGLAHLYQGWAGVIAAGAIGSLLAVLYVGSRRNLWPVILCHGLVDTVALTAIYLGHRDWLFP